MLEGIMGKIASVRVLDVPLGKAFLLTAFMGINDALRGTLQSVAKIPDQAGAPLLAILWRKVGAIRGFVGDDASELLSQTAIASAIDDWLNISQTVSSQLSALTGGLGTPMISPDLGQPFEEAIAEPSVGTAELGQGQFVSDVERKITSALRAKLAA